MTYSVYDCIADIELSRTSFRKEADEICAIHGGADNCIAVFEVEEPKSKPVKVESEMQPKKGELF